MSDPELEHFYNEYSERVSIPTFQKRVLFLGTIERDLQYAIPYILRTLSGFRTVYEPLRIHRTEGGTMRSFYRSFGRYPQNDLLVFGKTASRDDEVIQECRNDNVECRPVAAFASEYEKLMARVSEQAERSNLSQVQLTKIQSAIERSRSTVERSLR